MVYKTGTDAVQIKSQCGIGQIFGMSFRIAFGALKVLLQRRKRRKLEAKAAALDPPTSDTENTDKQIDEERMAANG